MADLNVGTYSPEDMTVVISVNEVTHAVGGWAEGSFLSVERAMASSTMVLGATAAGACRVFRSNPAATVSMTLTSSSSDNDVLMSIWEKDSETRDNSWLFNMTLLDGTGRSSFHCSQCYIENIPTATFGTETESRTWVIHAMQMKQYVGGNAKLPPDVVATLESLGTTVSDRWK